MQKRRAVGTRRQRREDEDAAFYCALLSLLIIGLAFALLG